MAEGINQTTPEWPPADCHDKESCARRLQCRYIQCKHYIYWKGGGVRKSETTEDDIRRATDVERGRFLQLLKKIEDEFWRVTRERDDYRRKLEASQHD